MTDAQEMKLYFPGWNRCAKANGWRMAGGRLVAEPQGHHLVPELAQVWTYARQLAEREHRGIEPGDLRHACHVVAIGRDKSHKGMNNHETNRVVALFDVLADPDSLAARVKWENPENSDRAGLIAEIRKRSPDGYVKYICECQYKTGDWESVPLWQLRNLLRTVSNRRPSFARRAPQRPALPKTPQQAGPVKKLVYIKKTNESEPF